MPDITYARAGGLITMHGRQSYKCTWIYTAMAVVITLSGLGIQLISYNISFNNVYYCHHGVLKYRYTDHICSGMTNGEVLNGELYAYRFQKLPYLLFYLQN